MNHDWRRDLARNGLEQSKIGQQLARLFQDHLAATSSDSRLIGEITSYKTQSAKARALINIAKSLREQRAKPIKSLWEIETHHVETLCGEWLIAGNTRGAIENKLSHLRALSKWLGRPHIVPDTDNITAMQGTKKRSLAATQDKSWSGNAIDIGEIIQKCFHLDPHVAIQLLLQQAFGLRVEESFLLRPANPVI